MGINYGFNKLRFLNPVKAGSKLRGRFTMKSARAASTSVIKMIVTFSMNTTRLSERLVPVRMPLYQLITLSIMNVSFV